MAPGVSTLIDLLRCRAQSDPDRLAYAFLSDDEAECRVTYGELDRQARAIGVWLQATTSPGDRVLLLYPQGLEYIAAFFGCLYAGSVAVPAYPPRRNRNLSRFQALASDAAVSAVLTTAKTLSRMSGFFEQAPLLESRRWLTSDTIPAGVEDSWRSPVGGPETLAFLQYTSGSTSTPKGVMVTHGNLLHNEELIRRSFQQTAESIIVGWLPLYHDMGLIGNVIQPLFVSAPCVLMSPVSFLQSPVRWLRTISRFKATTSGGPNFAYDLCVRKISDEDRAALDLSSWRVAFNGAEPVRADTMERFARAFADCGFRLESFHPCYGLAEATLLVSGGAQLSDSLVRAVSKKALEQNRVVDAEGRDEDARTLVGCGAALPGGRLVIVNPETGAACAPDEIGEVWVSGPSVARGYWNRPEETEQTFQAYLADSGEGPFLRTGDLGCLRDGRLFITGRLKDLIIIRGLNHYPQDIELSVGRSHPSLRPGSGAAFSVTVEGEERLVVVQETELRRKADWPSVVALIREVISEGHEIQAHAVVLIKAGTIPKTSSGKIQRRACRAMFLERSLEVVAEWHAAEASDGAGGAAEFAGGVLPGAAPAGATEAAGACDEVTARVREWLRHELAAKLRLRPEAIDAHEPIMRYGLDSLLAVELTHGIEAKFGVALPFPDLLDSVSVAGLAAQVRERLAGPRATARASTPQNGATEFPLSYGQQALWYLHEVATDDAAYNIARALRVRSEVDVPALRRALQRLVDRHPSLRTSFAAPHGEPTQTVHERREVSLEQFDASTLSEAELQEKLVADAYGLFDLGRAPLLRAGLYTLAPREHVLLLSIHHIVSDFWSLVLLMRELGAFYEAEHAGSHENLLPLTHSYADYVSWQEAMLRSPEGEGQWAFWRGQLEGELPVLNLPTDRPRPAVQTHRGAALFFRLAPELMQQLKALGRDCGATLYMTLLAAFQVLLARYTGQQEVIVGTPTSGRSRAELADVVGYFVNPVSLKATLTGSQTFTGLLREVRLSALQAFKHQDYPFPLLVKRLQPERDASRSPIFQAMFVWQQAQVSDTPGVTELALEDREARASLGGLHIESFALRRRVAQFDLTLMMAELSEGKGIGASLEYAVGLLDEGTMARMAAHYQNVLRQIASDPDRPLSEIQLLSPDERRQLLRDWNQTSTPYPRLSCLHELFEAQAARTPDATALVCGDERLSYGELNRRANQLARHLRALGAGPERLVAILMERSAETVVALLGVLKSGAAYLPLDNTSPAQRVLLMLSDSGARIVLTQESLEGRLRDFAGEAICLDARRGEIDGNSAENLTPVATADNLAYVIYTSGSTGKPKGVAITHRSLCNYTSFICGLLKLDELPEGGRASFATVSTLAADLGNTVIFPSLISGGRLHVIDYDIATDAERFASYFAEHRIDVLKIVPSHLNALLSSGGGAKVLPARYLLLGGEALPLELLARIREAGGDCEVINHYGPTETTVGALTCRLGESSPGPEPAATATIGRPIANTKFYVVDRHMNPVPIGVPGELCIGGAGVARGYLNRPALTAERLSPDPFGGDSGGRLYHTGDLVRYLPGGGVEFLGRIDRQVKIHSFRVEPGKIEAVLRRHAGVSEAVVAVSGDDGFDRRLVAYVVVNKDAARRQPEVDAEELRQYASRQLPAHMVPDSFVVRDEPLLQTEEEWRGLIEGLNATAREYPAASLLVHELFERQAARTPAAVAVEDSSGALTYAALDSASSALAARLRGLGVGAESLAAVMMERSSGLVVALLGVLKAGGAYIPLDPSYPRERLAFMLEDSGARLLLTERGAGAEGFAAASVRVVYLDEPPAGEAAPASDAPASTARAALPDNLAYVIYTSGSTGRPKGAMNTHRAVVNRLLWMQDEYGLTPADAVLQKTPFSFDVSVWEFFWPLLAGARLVMADPEGHRDPDYLARVINERGVTTVHFVPSMLNAFLHARGPERARTLRRVVCSGEELPYEMTERFFGQSEETGLHNLYGPTEAAVDVTYRVCRRDAPDTRVPIGRPVANTRVYVVDADGRPVAVGVPGELLIGGVQVGRGYLNRPALTAEKFVPDPFSGEAGSRLYRTGDLARWLPTGEVEYLGRMDSQVKVRGFRIEPGEVEAALLRHEGVREAAVVAREDVPGEKRLVAYVVTCEGSTPQAAELRGFLQKGLPDYMVPSAIVPLKALPLTSNGKLDRRALPAPDLSHDGASAAYVAPRTEAERQLAAIWQELLRVERVGVHDNFFELGGDSILSIQIVSKAHQLGLRLSPKHLFQYHTIAELAEAASGARAGADEGPVLGGSVPLTPVQRRFFEGDFAEPHHWNQSVLLETPGALDAPTLEKALEHLHLEHASLRLRFRRREGGWEQFVAAPGGPPPFEQFDLSGEPPEAQARLMEEKADELQASLNLSEGPISRAAYFKLGGGAPGRLLLIIHHLAVDAVSWRILVEDLTTVYQQLAGGRDVGLPFKTASFKRWAERLDAYARTPPVREEAGYWLSEARGRVRPIPLDGAGGDTVADARTLSMSLTAEETQALLREVPHALQTRIEDVLLAALGRTLSRWTGAREVLIDFEGHGREALFDDVDVSATVGWFTSVYPVLLEMPEHDGEPLQDLRGVKGQLRALPKRGIGYGLLRYSGDDTAEKLRALPRAEIVFNYLGQLDRGLPEGSFFTRAGESGGRMRSPRGRRLYLLEIIGSVAAGRLRLEWIYGEGAHRRETVERLMADFGESLRLFIEQSRSPQAGKPAPPDFPLARLSNEQLDDILQEVSFED